MIIFIDPGHGGNDSGAVGPTGLQETYVNLSIAINVREILKRHNIDARLTRNDDNRVELLERVNMANNSNANYFISIHINSFNDPNANGTETFAYHNSDIGNRLAASIQNNLIPEIKLVDRGVKTANFYVLRETIMPSALVEVAFISNTKEEKLLREESFINKSALGISKGILEFIGVEYSEQSEDENIQDNISDWAREAMKWATSQEINITDGSITKEPITLERLITILYRYHNLTNK